MSSWKLALLRSVGFGAGFAIALCAIIGTWFWYVDRPKPPQMWNKQAITAEYDYVCPEGDKDYLTFHYILQNNTDLDYRIEPGAGVELTNKMKREKGYGNFNDKFLTLDHRIFAPAKSRVAITFSISYPYPDKEKENATPEETKQFTTNVAKYVTNEMGNLDGFVMFDTNNRYEIDFPAGWEQRAKEGTDSTVTPKQR